MKAFRYLLILSSAVLLSGCGNVPHRNQSTVSVTGTGTVTARPDMARMSIALSNTAPTTEAAQREVNRMVAQALDVLKGFGVEDKNITTAGLTFNPQYEFTGGQRRLVGQNARQTIAFTLEGIQGSDERVPRIIDRLVQINGIELNQMDFGIRDNSELSSQARELAFRKAAEKARQFAELSGLKVGRVLSVAEEGSPQIMPMNNRFMVQSAAFMDTSSGSAVPAGEQEITTRVSVIFALE